MLVWKLAGESKVCNLYSRIGSIIAEKDVHVFHISMYNAVVMNVLKAAGYLLYNALSPGFGQILHFMDTEVVHKIATLSELGHDVGVWALSERFYETDHMFAVLTFDHCISFRDVVLFFQLSVLGVVDLFDRNLQSSDFMSAKPYWIARIITKRAN